MTRKKLRVILTVFLCLFIIVGVVSAIAAGNILYQYSHSKAQYEKLESYVTVEVPKKSEVVEAIPDEEEAAPVTNQKESKIKVEFDMDFAALKEINEDLVGWLYYEPLDLSYPVVMDKGDDYYEHYSFEKERNVAGAIFVDYLCRSDLDSFNTIIYGHNMRNGSMFGRLNEVVDDGSLVVKNPYFYIFTEDEALMYEIITTYYTTAGSRTYGLALDYTFEEMQEYSDYIEGVAEYKNMEFFKKGINKDTKICTLSTCHGVNSTSRTVIQGVLVAREPR